MINIEQTRWTRLCIVKAFLEGKRDRPMFSSQCDEWDNPHIIALVELDMQKLRVNVVLSREAIRERLRALERPPRAARTQAVQPVSDKY